VVPDEPLEVIVVVGPLWVEPARHLQEDFATPPLFATFADLRQQLVTLLVVMDGARPGVVEDQALDAIRIRRCEDRAGGGRLRNSGQRRPLAADRVKDRAEIVHARLDGEPSRPVGEAHAAQVDDDHAPPIRETPENFGEGRRLPERVQVGQKRQEDEIRRPFPDDLVCDRDVTAAGVADVGHFHGRILIP
jgi:hypothetical protein